VELVVQVVELGMAQAGLEQLVKVMLELQEMQTMLLVAVVVLVLLVVYQMVVLVQHHQLLDQQ
jgi:hypothetical protein